MSDSSGHTCKWCQSEFAKQNSVTRRQVVWVRMTVRLFGNIIRVRGAICARCRDRLVKFQVAVLNVNPTM